MKHFLLLLVSLLLALSGRSQGSLNIVGYYNMSIYSGDNLIGNQLSLSNNTLNAIFNPNTPIGSTFTRWDPVTQQFAPLSVYTGPAMGWTINYSLNFGEGAQFHSPTLWTNTFVGEVSSAFDPGTGVLNWHPNYANGLHLLSSPIPVNGPMDMMFSYVTGRLPQDGEWAAILDPATQLYTITTFHTVSGWDNGDPVLGIGQAAWFDLGGGLPATLSSLPMVPEPNAVALAGLGIGVAFIRRRSFPTR